MLTLQSLCLSLLLLSIPVDGYRMLPERLHRIRHHAPRDFREYPQLLPRASSVTGASRGISITGGGTAYSSHNYTFARDWRTKSISAVAGSTVPVVLASSTPVAVGTRVVTTEPAYQVCDTASRSCSTVLQTRTTIVCSTVLTGFFTRVTVTDCDQSVTFSTKSSFIAVTSGINPSVIAARQAQFTPSIQSVVSYYVAPWQSIAANNPADITIVVCTFNAAGQEICSKVREVWVVHTELVPVTQTKTVTVSQHFSTAALVVLGGGQTTIVPSGGAQFFAIVVYSTVAANETTVRSQIGASEVFTTRTTTIASTVQVTNVNVVTLTRSAGSLAVSTSIEDPLLTTTITRHSTVTRTITLAQPSRFAVPVNGTSLGLNTTESITTSPSTP